MATSTIFNFNFNNSEIVDSTGQWYNATTGTPTTEFIEHDGNTALLQRAYVAETSYTRDINPVFFQSRDPTFTAHTYTIELQIYPLRDAGGFGPWDGPVLEFNTESDEEGWVSLVSVQRASISNTFYWHEYGLGPDSTGIPFLTVTAADGTYNRWYSIRIERVDDGTNTGATIKIYVDGTLVVNETLTYPQDARRGRIGNSIRYTYRRSSIDPQGAGAAIDNFKLTAGIAPSSVVDVSLANLQRNNANLLSFIKGKVPTVNDGTLTIKVNGATAGTFTANQATAATANIQCVDLTSNQTVAGNKEFTGTTTAHDLVPGATDTYNFGSSSYQWNNAYIKSLTINGVACGDILTHNASEFVNVSNNQTISGTKTFIDRLTYKATNTIAGDGTSGNFAGSFNFVDKNGVQLGTLGLGVFNNNGYTEQALTIINPAWFNDSTKTKILGVSLKVIHETEEIAFIPSKTRFINLGNTTNKWKTINGINPGALSLPSNSYVNVDTTNWDLTCQNGLMGSFTPTADGWLMLHVVNSGTSEVNFWIIGEVLRISSKSALNASDNNTFNMITIPVEKDNTYNIYGNASEYVAGRSVRYCRFIQCQGNV